MTPVMHMFVSNCSKLCMFKTLLLNQLQSTLPIVCTNVIFCHAFSTTRRRIILKPKKKKKLYNAPPKWNVETVEEAQMNKLLSVSESLKFQDVSTLIKLIKTASAIRVSNPNFWKQAVICVRDVSSELTIKEAVQALSSFSLMNSENIATTCALLKRIEGGLYTLDTQQLLSLLSVHHIQRLSNKQIIISIMDILLQRFSTLRFNDIASIMRCLALSHCPYDPFIILAKLKFINMSSLIETQAFIWFMKACVNLKIVDKELKQVILLECTRRLSTLPIDIIVTLTKYCSQLEIYSDQFLIKMSYYLLQYSPEIPLMKLPALCQYMHHICLLSEQHTITGDLTLSPLTTLVSPPKKNELIPHSFSSELMIPSCYDDSHIDPINNWGVDSSLTKDAPPSLTFSHHQEHLWKRSIYQFFKWAMTTILQKSKLFDVKHLIEIYDVSMSSFCEELLYSNTFKTLLKQRLQEIHMIERFYLFEQHPTKEFGEMLLTSLLHDPISSAQQIELLPDNSFISALTRFTQLNLHQGILLLLFNVVVIRPDLDTIEDSLMKRHLQHVSNYHSRQRRLNVLLMSEYLIHSIYPNLTSLRETINKTQQLFFRQYHIQPHTLPTHYSKLMTTLTACATDELARACLMCPNSVGSCSWIWELTRRYSHHQSTFPIYCLPSLVHLVCQTITQSNQLTLSQRIDSQYSISSMVCCEPTVIWILYILQELCPVKKAIISCHSLFNPLPKNRDAPYDIFKLTPKGLTTLLHSCMILVEYLETQKNMYFNSNCDISNILLSHYVTDDTLPDELCQLQPQLLCENQLNTQLNLTGCQQSQNYMIETPAILSNNHIGTLFDLTPFHIFDYSNDESDFFQCNEQLLQSIRPFLIDTCLIMSNLLISRIEDSRLVTHHALRNDIQTHLKMNDFLKKQVPLTLKTNGLELFQAVKYHNVLNLVPNLLLLRCTCMLSRDLTDPVDLLNLLRIISTTTLDDMLALEVLGGSIDKREKTCNSVTVSQEINELCSKLKIEHLEDVTLRFLNRSNSGTEPQNEDLEYNESFDPIRHVESNST